MQAEVDAEVQTAIDAFNAVDTVLTSGDYTDLKDIDTLIGAVNTAEQALTDEQLAVYLETIGEDKYFDVAINAGYVSSVFDYMDEYTANRNALNAYNFVSTYNVLPENIQTVLAGDTAFKNTLEDAVEDMPSDNVVAVADAYSYMIVGAIFFGTGDGEVDPDFKAGVEGFGAALDTLDALTEEELVDLAAIISDYTGETVASTEVVDYLNEEYKAADELLTFEEAYLAYTANPNKDTAAAYVKIYDTVFSNTEYEELGVLDTITTVYEKAEADYKTASASLAPVATAPTETTTADREVIADTSDPMTMLPFTALVMSAAAIAVSKKKRV